MCKDSKKSPEDAMIDELISAFVVQRIEGNGIALDDALRDSIRRCSTSLLDRIADRVDLAQIKYIWEVPPSAEKDQGLERWQTIKNDIHKAWMVRWDAQIAEQKARYPHWA